MQVSFHYITPAFPLNASATIKHIHLSNSKMYLQYITHKYFCNHKHTNSIPTHNTASYSKSSQHHTTNKANVYSENQQSETSIYIKPTTTNHKIKYILHYRIIRFEELPNFGLILIQHMRRRTFTQIYIHFGSHAFLNDRTKKVDGVEKKNSSQ